VVEAGLGGRWDATNVLDAPVVVLTNVGLEHTRWLGPTVADIAREKLAVVRPGATLVLGDVTPEVLAQAEATEAAIVRPDPVEVAPGRPQQRSSPAATPVLPGYQRTNFAVAAAAARALLGERWDPACLAAAAAHAQVPGRLQRVAEAPLTVLDGAHNPSGMAALVGALPDAVGERKLVAVVSILDDKDAAGMLRALLPRCAGAVFCASRNPRALPAATLASLAAQLSGPPAEVVADPPAALERARELAGPEGAVLATGSIYLVADLVSGSRERRVSAL
jgi:dihydrofolate synthase/folylpolyglutamate synthase